jgi:hypothetical protein
VLDRAAYEAVFAPPDAQGTGPGYLIAPDPAEPSAVHWRLFGAGLGHVESLRRAWDVASGMGLGPARQRFVVRQCLLLGPDHQTAEPPAPWTLDQAVWPLSGDPATAPCRLVFPGGLRLMRDKCLLTRPTLADVSVAALRRAYPLLPAAPRDDLDDLHDSVLEIARRRPSCPWRGDRHDLRRWSSRQRKEIELRGVRGELELPDGPGPLWPLLLLAGWLHVGKGTTQGLGQMLIQPTEASGNSAARANETPAERTG